MKVSIMQPHLFMWPGLLQSIVSSDLHIVLDTVTSSKNDRYNRNKIAGNSSERWLTLPFVDFSRHLYIGELIVDSDPGQIDKLANLFDSRYSDAAYKHVALSIIKNLMHSSSNRLCDAYVVFLETLKDLGFDIPNFIFSSQLDCGKSETIGLKGARLIDKMLNDVNATTYLAAQNVRGYSSPEDYTVKSVLFQCFVPHEYNQYSKGRGNMAFIPYLSVLDAIASIGIDETKSYLVACNQWLV